MIRFIRKFGTFKRPPPDYIFKRPVVKSDIDGSKMKHFPNYDIEHEKWFDDDTFNKEIKDKWDNSLYNDYNDRHD